jgi:rubrerythrin
MILLLLFLGRNMAYYEPDGFEELRRRARAMKRYDILEKIDEAEEESEREYLEALKCPKCGAIRKETPYGLFCPNCD